jgi:hypothetical protein
MSRCTRGAALNSIIPISVSDEKKSKGASFIFPIRLSLVFFSLPPSGAVEME